MVKNYCSAHGNATCRELTDIGLIRMYPLVPEDMLEACIQMACYVVTMIGAMVGWLMTGRIA